MLPPLSYLSFDSVTEGVGRSQITPYVAALAQQGMQIVLHTFEKHEPSVDDRTRLETLGVDWKPHPFGGFGPAAGAKRVVRGAWFLRGADLVHARGDLPAAAASIHRAPWIWDMRSMWTDQRIALGALKPGSPEERVLRVIERRSSRTSSSIVVLARAAIGVMQDRFGGDVARKCSVVPTCVDLNRFSEKPLPPTEPIKFLLLGTLNNYYDVPLMLRLVERFRRTLPAQLNVIAPARTVWTEELQAAGAKITTAPPSSIPRNIHQHHVGLSVCRSNAGVSLRAAMPTKIGEFLASGRPVVANPGLGDMDEIVAEFRCGVVLAGSSEEQLDRCCAELLDLLYDQELPRRARAAAVKHFNLDSAVDTLMDLYRRAAR